jgi:ketosteroid isomerase-like protein
MTAAILAGIVALAQLRAAIAAENATFVRAYRHGNAAAMASSYEDAGRFVAKNADVRGRAAIQAYFQRRVRVSRLVDGACRTTELSLYGNLAVESGFCRYTVQIKGHKESAGGHYLTIWSRVPVQPRWRIKINVALP